MPQANIWIKKKNLSKWEAIQDKSNWVNTLLENSDDTSHYGAVRETVIGPIIEVLSENVPEFKPCKHNADPKFCRFARPGKPCK